MKQTITEEQLKTIIRESVKGVLNEALLGVNWMDSNEFNSKVQAILKRFDFRPKYDFKNRKLLFYDTLAEYEENEIIDMGIQLPKSSSNTNLLLATTSGGYNRKEAESLLRKLPILAMNAAQKRGELASQSFDAAQAAKRERGERAMQQKEVEKQRKEKSMEYDKNREEMWKDFDKANTPAPKKESGYAIHADGKYNTPGTSPYDAGLR